MGLAVKSLSCNGGCRDCYENRLRDAGADNGEFDLAAVERIILAEAEKPTHERGRAPSIHGGEPLILPFEILSSLLTLVHRHWGRSSIQTNLLNLEDRHIELFRRCGTSVGVSLNGNTALLNWGRWNYNGNTTEQFVKDATERTWNNLGRLAAAEVPRSIITVLSKQNAGTLDRRRRFVAFVLEAERKMGVRNFRFNPLIDFSPNEDLGSDELPPSELLAVWRQLLGHCFKSEERAWLPFRDMVDLLFGFSHATCHFGGCDVWRTSAEEPINVSGGYVGNCLKLGAAEDGIFSMRAEQGSDIREAMLASVPLEDGGCRNCKYWALCRGGCPGEGADGDYRNKTRFCLAIWGLFQTIEGQFKEMLPNFLSAGSFSGFPANHAHVRSSIEGSTWEQQFRKTPEQILAAARVQEPAAQRPPGEGHGDREHGDRPHGDRPHGDGR